MCREERQQEGKNWIVIIDNEDYDKNDLYKFLEVAWTGYSNHIEWFVRHRNTTLKQIATLIGVELILLRFYPSIDIPNKCVALIFGVLAILSVILALAGQQSCKRSFSALLEYIMFMNKIMWAINPSGRVKIKRSSIGSLPIPACKDEFIFVKRYMDDASKVVTTAEFVKKHLGGWLSGPRNSYFWAKVVIWALSAVGFILGVLIAYILCCS